MTELSSNILDTIMGSQTQSSLSSFEPEGIVSKLLAMLKERVREILVRRFGLEGRELSTLEAIGTQHNLTRERGRQIEKDSIEALRHKGGTELEAALRLIFDTIAEYGDVMSEEFFLETLLPGKENEKDRQAVKFLLAVGEQFHEWKETGDYYHAFALAGFNEERLTGTIAVLIDILKAEGRVFKQDDLSAKLKDTDYYRRHQFELTDKVLKSYLSLSKQILINPFGEIGLASWNEVRPRDVGDKAYLVLKHHGKPEHYSIITKMINARKFDHRTAYQETVHNELIKDNRFVLIGRGIYALSEWGYKKGVVADVIIETLTAAQRPLSRDEIINEVLKRRMVKRNTILVGLSNKKRFQKVGKDKFTLV